jgi:quercetin dioxygenase-like cupin family protein
MSGDDELDPDRLADGSIRFRKRVVELAPAQELPFDVAAWRDAIVFLTDGEIELECMSGERQRFARGAILCLAPPLRLLRNSGNECARLLAISRRRPAPQKRTG